MDSRQHSPLWWGSHKSDNVRQSVDLLSAVVTVTDDEHISTAGEKVPARFRLPRSLLRTAETQEGYSEVLS